MMIFGKALTAVALLAAAVTLLIVSTTEHNATLARWAVLTAMAGFTMVLIVVIETVVNHAISEAFGQERQRTEQLIQAVANGFAEREVGGHLRQVPEHDSP